MSDVMVMVAWLAVLNPPRTALGLVPGDTGPRRGAVVAGVAIGVVALCALTAAAGSVLDVLDVTAPMASIAAGLVLFVVASWMLVVPVPPDEPVPRGMRAALWPVAYPRIVSPESIVLALAVGTRDGVMVVPVVLAGAVVVAVSLLTPGPLATRVLAASGRVAAVVLVVVAVVLAVAGIREV